MIQIKLITALISSVVGVMTMAPVAMSKPHRPVASCSLRYPVALVSFSTDWAFHTLSGSDTQILA